MELAKYDGKYVRVTDKEGKVFIRESDVDLTVERNGVRRLGAIEVTPDDFQDPETAIE